MPRADDGSPTWPIATDFAETTEAAEIKRAGEARFVCRYARCLLTGVRNVGIFFFQNQVELSRVLGLTCYNDNSLCIGKNAECVVYPSG